MAKPQKKTPTEARVERMSGHIYSAQWALERTLFEPLLEVVQVRLCQGASGEPTPLFACADGENGIVWANPFVRQDNELTAPEWEYILAHELLHFALNQFERGRGADPIAWNIACDCVADGMLRSLKIGAPPERFVQDYGLPKRSEDELYEEILTAPKKLPKFRTFAGDGRPDMWMGRREAISGTPAPRKPDYEALFAEGIRLSVERAVQTAADLQNETGGATARWHPLEYARRWVVNETPLLAGLAFHLRVIVNAEVCRRMDISIAAVNPFLGEVYFNPEWNFTREEVLFVYVHEILHVALLHHTRLLGRDPEIWNIACDFVINAWLVEMGVGVIPKVGVLYDPRLQGMSAEEVYDLLMQDKKRCKGLRGLRGKLGDILYDGKRVIQRDDVRTLDDIVRRCMAQGLNCSMRGKMPAGLLEEIRSLFTPPVPWDVELAHWMDAHVPTLRDPLRSYARASRRQASTPDIPRPARYIPQEWLETHTFGVVLDTSGSMDRELLGRALGAIASYAEARDVPSVRVVQCDAAPYDQGFLAPHDLRGTLAVRGRGGTVLQAGVNFLLNRADFPASAPVMIITDGWCEEEILCPREHCFLLPRKAYSEGAVSLRTNAPVFRVLKYEHEA